jgi:hypothetical protein
MSLTKLSLAGNNFIIPGQGEFGKWHPSWGRENRQPFFTVLEPRIKSWYIWYGWKKPAELLYLQRLLRLLLFLYFRNCANGHSHDKCPTVTDKILHKTYFIYHLCIRTHMNTVEEWDVVQCLNCFIIFLFYFTKCFGINKIFTLWRGIHSKQLPTLMISFN